MQDVQTEIERGNERFWRYFSRMNYVWMVVSLVTLIIAAKGTFQDHPTYLRDWHLLAIVALSLVMMGIYCLALFYRVLFKSRALQWPHRSL